MKPRLAIVSAVLLTFGAVSVAAASGPATKVSFPAAGAVFVCETTTYTAVAGEVNGLQHETESASGNSSITGTFVASGVILEDPWGNAYRLRGAVWFGESFNAQAGTGVATFTAKFQIVAPGSGTVDSVNLVFHASADGTFWAKDAGTCELPPEP